ncbi:hypothetical protein GCM10022247_34300 [Allokutzneria multivorans]|uniref:Uncharacterized protein n=1 Tax=Allokutzneria multivorans TaxID=1142134 RepID=A0ABP7SBM5_9PSEU
MCEVDVKKILTLAAIALVLYLLLNDPQGAANGVQNVFGWLRDAAQAVITFIQRLFA